MTFEVISTSADTDKTGKFNLKMLAISPDMVHYAESKLGRLPEIGDEFTISIAYPNKQRNPVAATQDDYEDFGEASATGVIKRVS